MPIINPNDFNQEDLFLEVRLTVVGIDGTSRDYTGKRTFDVEFFRKNIGFGITDVSIEVNTSLQPIVEIKFKDLYANTSMGTQKDVDDRIDYSVLFDWPPPKFKFTFKGYLGGPVTWILSLKKTKSDFVASDGSFEITATFVPNQWGFFSDIPFLFLLANKTLRHEEKGLTTATQQSSDPTSSKSDQDKAESIFDLIKIGKKVEVKTKETTKEFEVLQQQLTIVKTARILESSVNSKTIKFGEAIDGTIQGGKVDKFNTITIKDPGKILGNENLKNEEQLKSFLNSASDLKTINEYLIYISDIGGLPGIPITFAQFQQSRAADAAFGMGETDGTGITAKLKIVDDDITLVDKATKAKFYESSKDQLRQITIGEIFKQLSKDSAYILGRILAAGFDGYEKNQATRDAKLEDKTLIGTHYPLYRNKDGEEVPAEGVNIENYEMKFVNDFIKALTEGLARDYDSDDNTTTALDDSKLKKRLSNLEVNKDNPYKPFFKNIAENVMFRSAIAAFFIGSDDVNRPGYHDTEYLTNEPDRGEVDATVFKLADADSENITDNIIKDLDASELLQLKRFCTFFVKLFSSDGESFLDENGKEVSQSFPSPGSPISDDIWNYQVVIEKGQADGSGRQVITVKNFFASLLTGKPIEFSPNPDVAIDLEAQLSSESPFSYVDLASGTAVKFINNGLPWFKPLSNSESVFYVIMNGQDATDSLNTMTWDSDITYRSGDGKDDYGSDVSDVNSWRGFVSINRYQSDTDEQNPTNLVDFINTSIDFPQYPGGVINVLNFGNITAIPNEFFDAQFMVDDAFTKSTLQKLMFSQKIGDPNNFNDGETPAQGLSFAPYMYNFDSVQAGSSSAACFAPLSDGDEPNGQRAFIKKICQSILDKIINIEQERTNVISRVLGNSTQQNNLIYKQFHNIFHQWYSLIGNGEDGEIKDAAKSARELELRFSESHLSKEEYDSQKETDAQTISKNGVFVYDYPLNRMSGGQPVKVANSLIDIQPMYKPNANTTVLNIIQQICTKNNFLFIPLPGSRTGNYLDIFKTVTDEANINSQIQNAIINYFYVSFAPTPESRAKLSNSKEDLYASVSPSSIGDGLGNQDAFLVKFGDPSNNIVKSVTVGTEENKPTAESILNLQKLVDKENSNKAMGNNCSMLPVMEGRSYKASFDMLGCSQVYPMDYFFLDNLPLFKGLYQVMKVKHTISPNTMATTCEGIKMRFDANSNAYAAIQPITLDSLAALSAEGNIIESGGNKLTLTAAAKGNTGGISNNTQNANLLSSSNQGGGDQSLFTPSADSKVNDAEANKIIAAMTRNSYVIYRDGKVNIVGVRKYPFIGQPISDKFDDLIYLIWYENGKIVAYKYPCTTKPGLKVMKGSAGYPGNYLVEGQYLEVWVQTTYKDDHPAFADSKKFNTYFDRNHDAVWNPEKIESPSSGGGFFQHSVYVKNPAVNVNTWSAGCQVIPDRNKQLQFQSLARAQAAKSNQKKFTYTLLKSTDVV